MILLSAIVFVIPSISAARVSFFTDCEEIYIDLRSFTNWENNNAKIRVYTFYGDSDADWNRENNEADNDSLYNNGTKLKKSIEAVWFCDHVYSFRIPANNIGYVKVVRTDSGVNTRWNDSGYVYNNQRTKTGGNHNNCIVISGYDNSFGWSTFQPTNNASYSNVTANPDSSITGNPNLYPIDAKFYDYYVDDEVQRGWGNIRYQSGHSYWEPYQAFNKAIATQARTNSIASPMYFGNFYGKNDNYIGEGAANLYNFKNKVNNSSNLGGANKVVTGLTGKKLNGNQMVYSKANNTDTSVKVPFFDETWLSANRLGSVVNTKFPMRIEKDQYNNTFYAFDSDSRAANGGDNVWLSRNRQTISYRTGTSYGAKDALYYYSAPLEQSGYGFFPFDYNRGQNVEAYNFGFGMRVDIKFNVANNGLLNGNVPEKFTFTGDDDVWVYVDGVLVLDLGGAHKKAKGEINFNTKTATVNTGVAENHNGSVRNGSFPSLFGASGNQAFNNQDPTAEHTLTMFYVERGMVESNLSFNFNFTPVGNEFIVDKTVYTENVNEGLRTDVAAADTFTFTQTEAVGKTYSKKTASGTTGGTVGSDGKYSLKDSESVSFKSQFTPGTYFTVTESENSVLEYDTSWEAVDLVLKGNGRPTREYLIAESDPDEFDTKRADFLYKTKDTSSSFAMTRVQLSYTNTPVVSSFSLTKEVSGLSSGQTDTTDFNGKVEVSLNNGSTWKVYPLKYKIVGDNNHEYTLTGAGKLANNAQLRHNRTLVFNGIPAGAKVRFTEDRKTGYSHVRTTGGSNGVAVSISSGAAIKVTNMLLNGGATVEAVKTLDSTNYTGSSFTFTLRGLPSIGGSVNTSAMTPKHISDITNGNISFDLTGLNQPGTYRYILEEEVETEFYDSPDYDYRFVSYGTSDVTIDNNKRIYLVSVQITQTGSGLTPNVTYYNYNGPGLVLNVMEDYYEDANYTITAADFADSKKRTSIPKFENISLAPFSITKTVTGDGADNNVTFNGTVEVMRKGTIDWEPEQLTYTASDLGGSFTLTDEGKLDSRALLKHGRTLNFEKLPAGTKVRFIEDNQMPDGYSFFSVTGDTRGITISAINSNQIEVVNDYHVGGAVVQASKTLDGENYTGKMFTFTLQGLPQIQGILNEDNLDMEPMQVTTVADGAIQFNLTNLTADTYCYVLREEVESVEDGDGNIYKNEITIPNISRYFLVKVESVPDDEGFGMHYETSYYPFNGRGESITFASEDVYDYTVNASDFADAKKISGTPTFENEVRKPSVTVQKTNQADDPVKQNDTKFALYKVSGNLATKEEVLQNGVLFDEQTTNSNGIAYFEELDLYAGEYWNATTSDDLEYQWYAIVEIKAPAGHTPSNQAICFKFPTPDEDGEDTYDYTFKYQNGVIINPYTGSSGNTLFKVIGWTVSGVAVLSLGAYLVLTRRKKQFARKRTKK